MVLCAELALGRVSKNFQELHSRPEHTRHESVRWTPAWATPALYCIRCRFGLLVSQTDIQFTLQTRMMFAFLTRMGPQTKLDQPNTCQAAFEDRLPEVDAGPLDWNLS